MLAIFLSLIGVFGGLIITGSAFVIMMTMMGIIALAGIVVNNGVVLLDYTQLLIDRKKVEQDLDDTAYLAKQDLLEAIIKGGKARLRPVLLTAITTILGLIPLATGLNINFFTLFSEFNPNIYVGGDNVIFWGPLAWTVIYGLVIATFLTLIVVPILFYLVTSLKMRMYKIFFSTCIARPLHKIFRERNFFFHASKGEPLGREAGHPPPLDATGGGAHAFTTERPGTPGA